MTLRTLGNNIVLHDNIHLIFYFFFYIQYLNIKILVVARVFVVLGF